jgi:hypothetical protein
MSHDFLVKVFCVFLFGFGLVFSNASRAQGGPPLITDDPGTPGAGHWEINLVTQITPSTSDKISYQAPLVDANYGWGDHLQINLVGAWMSNVDDEGTANGLSKISGAVKWRFIDEKDAGFDLSIYPRIDTLFPLSAHDPRVNEDGVRYFLPVELAKTFGKWGINPEVGYAYNTRVRGEWNYGLAGAYEIINDREILAEVHARCPIGKGAEVIPQLGTRFAFSEAMSFIGAIGHTISTPTDVPAFWNIYAGVQLRL